MKKLTIDERFDLLDEAYQFYSDLFLADSENDGLWKANAVALATIISLKNKYEEAYLDTEWSDEEIERFIKRAVHYDDVKRCSAVFKGKEKTFFEWWIVEGLGILKWEEDVIKMYRDTVAQYNEFAEATLENRTLADLLC